MHPLTRWLPFSLPACPQRSVGKATYPGGHTYEGEWLEGLRSGFGDFRSAEGDRYEGEWRDDVVHGEGGRGFQGASCL
jgi:hypothetical protein